jgi:hypothetical protein
VISVIVTAVLTAVLVLVTWRYARSTEVIAAQTGNAATSARDAAQINLLNSLLQVQPLLEVADVRIEYTESQGIPFRVAWVVSNSGTGSAFSPRLGVRFGEVDLALASPTDVPAHIHPAERVPLVHTVKTQDWTRIAAHLANNPDPAGELSLDSHDAFGFLVECRTDLHLSNGQAGYGQSRRLYEGGPELRRLLRSLLDRLTQGSENGRD